MFAVRHTPSGMWLMDRRALGLARADPWTVDIALAAQFLSKGDADRAAYLEASRVFPDVETVSLEALAAVNL